MTGVEYRFEGLDEWEQALARVVEQQYPAEFLAMVKDVAVQLEGRAKKRTPFKTGHLLNEWRVGEVIKKGDTYYVEVFNNVEYAEPVEYGHRTRGGNGFVKGKHMMALSLDEVERQLPGHLKEWLADFLDTHDL